MSTPRTERLDVVVGTGSGLRLLLVPTLCGIVVAGSWVAGCLAIVLPH